MISSTIEEMLNFGALGFSPIYDIYLQNLKNMKNACKVVKKLNRILTVHDLLRIISGIFLEVLENIMEQKSHRNNRI